MPETIGVTVDKVVKFTVLAGPQSVRQFAERYAENFLLAVSNAHMLGEARLEGSVG